jgi:hypothetical protein
MTSGYLFGESAIRSDRHRIAGSFSLTNRGTITSTSRTAAVVRASAAPPFDLRTGRVSGRRGLLRSAWLASEETPAAMFDDPENVCAEAESLLLQSTAHGIDRARHYLHRAIERWPQRADLQVTLASTTLAALDMECMSPDEGVPLLRRSASLGPGRHARRRALSCSDR